ncbi:MAG: hypothetical protein FWG93_07395, partial [Oscillospiraceae bacterium]|nr:hypothetical protein [Oscillospiraceae bacterium]
MKHSICIALLCLLLLSACFGAAPAALDGYGEAGGALGAASSGAAFAASSGTVAGGGELRGVWVASVFNIDYPASATPDDQALRR